MKVVLFRRPRLRAHWVVTLCVYVTALTAAHADSDETRFAERGVYASLGVAALVEQSLEDSLNTGGNLRKVPTAAGLHGRLGWRLSPHVAAELQ